MLNFNDNVSEMVAEKGMNWKILDTLSTAPNLLEDIHYDKSNNWLGFRCVATMK